MPTPNAPHRSKQPDFRSRPPRSYFVVLLALVVGLMAYAGAPPASPTYVTRPLATTRCVRRCRDGSV